VRQHLARVPLLTRAGVEFLVSTIPTCSASAVIRYIPIILVTLAKGPFFLFPSAFGFVVLLATICRAPHLLESPQFSRRTTWWTELITQLSVVFEIFSQCFSTTLQISTTWAGARTTRLAFPSLPLDLHPGKSIQKAVAQRLDLFSNFFLLCFDILLVRHSLAPYRRSEQHTLTFTTHQLLHVFNTRYLGGSDYYALFIGIISSFSSFWIFLNSSPPCGLLPRPSLASQQP